MQPDGGDTTRIPLEPDVIEFELAVVAPGPQPRALDNHSALEELQEPLAGNGDLEDVHLRGLSGCLRECLARTHGVLDSVFGSAREGDVRVGWAEHLRSGPASHLHWPRRVLKERKIPVEGVHGGGGSQMQIARAGGEAPSWTTGDPRRSSA